MNNDIDTIFDSLRKPPWKVPVKVMGSCGDEATENAMIALCYRTCGRTNGRWNKPMDKEEELVQILGKLSGGRIEDVAEKIIAFFREPAWWEKEFDEKFVVHGSMGAFQDWEKRDAVKSFISSLLTRAKQEARQEAFKEFQHEARSVIAMLGMLEDNTDRQRIIDFIQEYMLKEKP